MKAKYIISGLLIGTGIGFGFIPILIASLLMGDNLFIELIDRMDEYWEEEFND